MKTLNLVQGSPEWHAHRAKHFNASEAPVVMGASKFQTRTELLDEKYTGMRADPGSFQQKVFDRGHEVEALARPLIEKDLGEDLYPVIGVSDDDPRLSASYDGLNMLGTIQWECKQMNQEKLASIQNQEIPEVDYWQVVHQFLVNEEAEECIYTITDGTEEGTESLVVHRNEIPVDDFGMLMAAWDQFEKDLAEHVPAAVESAPQGVAPDRLPALKINVTGMVEYSNLDEFKTHALAVIGAINTNLQTDEDFASAEATVKWCKDVESRLEEAKERALAQTADIDEMFRVVDEIKEQARQTRLNLDKQVKTQKEQRKRDIVEAAKQALGAHTADLQAEFSHGIVMPSVIADFAGAIHGKKNLASMRSAVSDALANAKIEANAIAKKIRGNLARYAELAKDHEFLFRDLAHIVTKAPDDFEAAVKLRIQEHQAAEQKKQDAERERIREEEARKLREEQAEQERKQQEAERQAQAAREQERPTEAPKPAAEVTEQRPQRVQATKPSRPTDAEIIEVLALHYRVQEATVVEWLSEIRLKCVA